MSTIKERVRIALNAYHFSVSKLAGGYCTSAQTKLNRQINGDTAMTAETLEHVLKTFPNLSAEWLLRGEGTMYKMDHERTHAQTDNPMPQPPTAEKNPERVDDLVALQKDAILQRDKQIALMESMIAMLRSGH